MDPGLIRGALAGDARALSELLAVAMPVVQARVARGLLRRPAAPGCDSSSDVADLTQAVWVALLISDRKSLAAWDPARGLTFASLVGLLAQRRVSAILRTRIDHAQTSLLDPQVANDVGGSAQETTRSREILSRLLERLRAQLSARGMELFERLFVAQQPIAQVCAQMNLTENAVHQWRRRLGHAAQAALQELQAATPARAAAQPPVAVSGIKLRRGP